MRSEPWAAGREVQKSDLEERLPDGVGPVAETAAGAPHASPPRTGAQAGITEVALFFKSCVGESRLEPAESLGFAVCGLPSFGREGRLEGADARCVQEFGGFQHAAPGDPLEGQGKRRSGPSYAKRILKNFNVDVAHDASDPSDTTGHEFGIAQLYERRQEAENQVGAAGPKCHGRPGRGGAMAA